MSLLSFQLPDKIVMEKSDDFHGLFTFKPLQPGYGVTIGNVVRRVLLSSLEGYAITAIKIPNILHEFSTVEGITHLLIFLCLTSCIFLQISCHSFISSCGMYSAQSK